jgi:DNA polymerase sigma
LQEIEKTDMTIEDQINLFISKMESTEEDVAIRMKICASLEQWLSFKYPGCRIIPFGSVTSGLALRGSDLDLCLDIPQGNPIDVIQRA